jgi:glutamate--cysteine ligase
VRARVERLFDGGAEPDGPGRVGLEIEVIPVRERAGRPLPVTVAEVEPALRGVSDLYEAGHVSFEPGGQLELSPDPEPDVATALARVDALMARVAAALPGIALHAGGTNPWHTREELGLQTDRPRYRTMQAHFEALGPAGTRMMRQTAALQVSLDLGGGPAAGERWRLLNLAGPALLAAFANSPRLEGRATDLASARSWMWQGADRSRTGFEMAQVGPPGGEVAAYTDFALGAAVIPLPRANGETEAASGADLRGWLASGGARPDGDDLDHHLTTLFPPVRPRRHLEVRYLDALPRRWAEVAIAALATLAYEPRARRAALEVAEAAPRGPAAWAEAAEHGVRRPGAAAPALALLEIARAGMDRLPAGYLGTTAPSRTDEYIERFTAAGRTPADDQLERARTHPEEPLPWT